MRIRTGLTIAFLLAGCGGSDEQAAVAEDSGGVETSIADTGAPADTAPGEETTETADTATSEDTTFADTTVADTTAPDTSVADTVALDTLVVDTTTADTFVAEATADTSVLETAVADTRVDATPDASSITCTTCHGDAVGGDPAPPRGTMGETATTSRAVGAHQAHLVASTWHRDVTCNECHVVPTSTSHANGTVEITFGTLAKTSPATPTYGSSTMTCSGVYCHGATLLGAPAGGTISRTPLWTKVDGTYDACGTTCHTNPPGGGHPNNDNCTGCHSPVIASYNATTRTATWVDRTKHINGVVDR